MVIRMNNLHVCVYVCVIVYMCVYVRMYICIVCMYLIYKVKLNIFDSHHPGIVATTYVFITQSNRHHPSIYNAGSI